MNRPPAYMNYAKEWIVGTMHLSLEEQGAYKRLLDYEWLEDGLPDNPVILAKILGQTSRKFARIWAAVSDFFPLCDDGLRRNPRLNRERAKYRYFHDLQSAKGKRSAQLRASRGSTAVQPGGNRHPNRKSTVPLPLPLPSPPTDTPPQPQQIPVAPLRARKETWLTPFADDWEAACGGEPSYPKLGRYFKKLVEKHGTEKVREHWRNFLAETDPQYVNPATFAEKFGSYGADRPQRLTAKQREERELALWATKGEPDGI